MKLYADSPGRRAHQIAGDLLVVAFVILCVWVGFRVHDLVAHLAAPGRTTYSAATDLATSLRKAGDAVAGIPFVPDQVGTPFEGGARAADGIARSGRSTADTAERLATDLGVFVGGLPIVLAAVVVLPGRVRWVRTATAGRRLIDGTDDLDLFALRAIVRQPLHVLARVTDDPAGAWRRGDGEVLTALALLELADCGLAPRRRRIPPPGGTGPGARTGLPADPRPRD